MLFARRGAICSAVNRRLKFRVGGSEVSQKHKFVTGSPKTVSQVPDIAMIGSFHETSFQHLRRTPLPSWRSHRAGGALRPRIGPSSRVLGY
jgi:hypothetical protein